MKTTDELKNNRSNENNRLARKKDGQFKNDGWAQKWPVSRKVAHRSENWVNLEKIRKRKMRVWYIYYYLYFFIFVNQESRLWLIWHLIGRHQIDSDWFWFAVRQCQSEKKGRMLRQQSLKDSLKSNHKKTKNCLIRLQIPWLKIIRRIHSFSLAENPRIFNRPIRI